MKKLFTAFSLAIFCLSASPFGAYAQPGHISAADFATLKKYEDTLGLVSFLVINDSLPENRFASTKKLIKTLVQALKIDHSFQYPFERMKAVSIQYPPDSTFRVFTWQLYVDVDEYRYYGAIQTESEKLELFPLIDRSAEMTDEGGAILSPENWYGALYYNIRQFDTPEGGRKYLLFGFDGYSLWHKRKLVEVLSFQEGKPVFGAPVFVTEKTDSTAATSLNRVLKEYSAETSFKLNFDETYDIIMFDHLILAGGNYGQGPSMVPDGSYEGYRLENGRWVWVEKVFHQIQEEAPRPEPILDSRPKGDIMGKGKN